MTTYRRLSEKCIYAAIFILSLLFISNSTHSEEKIPPLPYDIYSDLHIATGLFYASRDASLESKSAGLLTHLIGRLNESDKFSSSSETERDYSNFIKMLTSRVQEREPVTDYDCENLAMLRDKLLAHLKLQFPSNEACSLTADECFLHVKSMWSKVLSAYLYKSTDPAGMGGHSYFIEGETTTDIDGDIRTISEYLPGTSGLSIENQSSWAKLKFLKQSILQQQAGSVPFLVVHYVGSVYSLD